MKAIVVRPGEKHSIHLRDMPDPPLGPDEVAVRMVRAGLCATDAEINEGLYGEAPRGEEFLILGHENLGVVADVGKKVEGFKPGDLVVATVRRPCGECLNCRHGENDMCSSGNYEERGIMRRHGFLSEYYVESPEWLHKLPKSVEDVGVLLEPLSIVEKGIDQAFRLQKRLQWRPKTAMVLGGGPIGLLALAVLRLRGLDTFVVGRREPTDVRSRIATDLGARYLQVGERSLGDIQKEIAPVDLAIEATGSSAVAFDAMRILARNGVLCLLSVTLGSTKTPQPIDEINQSLVIGNRVVFGSVNANTRHFELGVKDLSTLQRKYPGVLAKLITTRLPWEDFGQWFGQKRSGIKTTLEITRRS
jgi:threonine dehydrogenase-like Zn-dependent dehydrogenase